MGDQGYRSSSLATDAFSHFQIIWQLVDIRLMKAFDNLNRLGCSACYDVEYFLNHIESPCKKPAPVLSHYPRMFR